MYDHLSGDDRPEHVVGACWVAGRPEGLGSYYAACVSRVLHICACSPTETYDLNSIVVGSHILFPVSHSHMCSCFAYC
jgi:hypothetical protein